MNGDESPYIVAANGTTVLRPASVASWLTVGTLAFGLSLMAYSVIESASAWFLPLLVPFAAIVAMAIYPLLIAHRLGLRKAIEVSTPEARIARLDQDRPRVA